MTWADVAIAEAVLLAVFVVLMLTMTKIMEHAQRAYARRENLLLNQVLHLSGRTWQPPPAPEPVADAEDGTDRYVYNTSQLLDDED